MTWTDITNAATQATTAIGDVVTQSATYVTSIATMLRDDPAAFARTVVDGYLNTSTVVANTFTFGLIPQLDARAQQLMDSKASIMVSG